MRSPWILVTAYSIAATSAMRAQTPPMGPEIPVNAYTTNIQDNRAGSLAIDRSGNFVLVWESLGQDGGSHGVYGRRYDAGGNPLGAEFPVNTYTTDNQDRPVVAGDRNGDFVVAWQSSGQDGDGYGVFARRFDASGNPLGGEIPVNAFTTGSQVRPAVAMNRSGRFVIVWWDTDGHDGSADGIFGQLYDDNGQSVGAEFPVNAFTTGAQRYPTVAMDDAGDFVVAWESAGADGNGFGISARQFDAAGAPIGGEIAVNTFTTGDQRLPAVKMNAAGNFVVVWDSAGADGNATGVAGRRFDTAGAPLTGEFLVNTFTTDYQGTADIAMDRTGNFLVAWQSDGQDGGGGGIFARAFDASCTPRTDEFPINTTTTGNQFNAAIAVNDGGLFAVGFENQATDPNGDILARVGAPQAAPLAIDAHAAGSGTSDLNGVLESGETVLVEPAYQNSLASGFNLSATAANFFGPPGPSYVLQDGTADYGPLSPGATNGCFGATGNCYVATVSGARPAAHWDVELDELLSTGITKSWALHVGESFPDVPRTQQFYVFIENLFHNGITSGCGSGSYCPTASVTRAQMAVFLLKSEHDSGYTPPHCAGIFADVLCPGPFTDWIEQLSAEGITGGCGSGNYCPNNPVTRAQMAVFLLKAEHGSSYAPPLCAGAFDDVACPSQYANWIEQLAAEQITGGCGNGNYCPNNPNTRGQMAVFLVKTFGLQLYGP